MNELTLFAVNKVHSFIHSFIQRVGGGEKYVRNNGKTGSIDQY